MTLYLVVRPDRSGDLSASNIVVLASEADLLRNWLAPDLPDGAILDFIEVATLTELVAATHQLFFPNPPSFNAVFISDAYNGPGLHTNPVTLIAFESQALVLTDDGQAFLGYPGPDARPPQPSPPRPVPPAEPSDPDDPSGPVMPYDPSDFQLVVPRALGVDQIADFNGASLIVFSGSATERKIADFFQASGMEYQPVLFTSDADMLSAFQAGRGDALAVRFGDRALASLPDPSQYIVIDPSPNPAYVNSVALLYEAGLGRAADTGGLNFWIDRVEAGSNLLELAANFLESNEFTTRFGDDDGMAADQFVNVMYQNVLGRPGEGEGVAYWISVMANGATREEVLVGFALSPENAQGTPLTALHQTSPGGWEFVV
jgi:hypothetical protein